MDGVTGVETMVVAFHVGAWARLCFGVRLGNRAPLAGECGEMGECGVFGDCGVWSEACDEALEALEALEEACDRCGLPRGCWSEDCSDWLAREVLMVSEKPSGPLAAVSVSETRGTGGCGDGAR